MTPRIFIVDDDKHTRILIQAHLKLLGEVHDFPNAQEAIQMIEEKGFPDLIISDIDMPGMSGLDFLKWIRQKKSSVPVILVSAFHSDANLFKALKMGATDFICKPFPLRNIQTAAENALKNSSPQGSFEVQSEASWISFTFDSNHEYLRRVNSLISTLVEKKTSKDVCNAIRLAIEEIGSNAIEWGNKNNPDLKVVIKYRLTPEKITLCIEDEGAGFTNLGLPEPPENPQELLKQRELKGKRVGGYGLNMVTQIMDEVVYSKSGSQIIMSRYLKREPLEAPSDQEAREGEGN